MHLRTHGIGISMVRTGEFKQLIRQHGVPNDLRGRLYLIAFCHVICSLVKGQIWQITSGAILKSEVKTGYYNELLTKFKGKQSLSTEEIERDLKRSFPGHPFYQREEGLSSLRNVLSAYSWHNQKIGYCQSMVRVSLLAFDCTLTLSNCFT